MVWLKQYVQNAILPVTLKSFDAKEDHNKIVLNWITSIELNNDYYIIERSGDGINYSAILTVKANNNNSNGSYTSYDNNPTPGMNYYRLVQFDKDGNKTYFSVKAINFTVRKNDDFQVYPNPASASFVISTDLDASKKGTITITDAFGSTVKTVNLSASGVQTISTDHLANGIYFIRINKNGNYLTGKFIIRSH